MPVCLQCLDVLLLYLIHSFLFKTCGLTPIATIFSQKLKFSQFMKQPNSKAAEAEQSYGGKKSHSRHPRRHSGLPKHLVSGGQYWFKIYWSFQDSEFVKVVSLKSVRSVRFSCVGFNGTNLFQGLL